MVTTPTGLRARKKQATATALQQSAIELFVSRGYDETTVQDITDVAGVSQRTFFRYYATKDAVLLTEHTRREDDVRAFLAARPEEPIGVTARAVVAHLAEDISERQELVKVQTQVFFSVPALADRFAGHHDRLAVIVAEHVARRLGVADDADARPRLVGSQVIHSWTTAILLWLTAGMTDDLATMAEDTLTLARCDPALVDAD